MKDIAVTEEETKEYYKANENQFMAGETVHAKHILVDEEDKCQEILEKIVAEEITFEDAAKEFSTCPSKQQGGDLGAFTRGQMVKEFEDAAFAAEIGHIVGPVKTQFGYHLIKVEDKKMHRLLFTKMLQIQSRILFFSKNATTYMEIKLPN